MTNLYCRAYSIGSVCFTNPAQGAYRMSSVGSPLFYNKLILMTFGNDSLLNFDFDELLELTYS